MALRPPAGARRRALCLLTVGATAASGVALLAPSTSSASSHREAPYTASDPAIDNTDTYAFVSPDDASTVTLIGNWQPFSEPAGGPNFFPWATDAAYDFNIDNNGDAKPDVVYRWTFTDVDRRGTQERGKVDGTFLYNDGPVTSLTDENLLFRQTYDLTVITNASSTAPVTTTLLNDAPAAPSNVGVKSMPDYTALVRQAVVGAQTPAGAAQSYVGQADDSFFLDLRIFDLLYGGDFSEVGFDTLSGYNVNTIALKVPKSVLVANGDASANPVIGMWSTTSRLKTRVLKDTNAAPATSQNRSSDAVDSSGDLVQVSRLGNPLVNEAVVPANLKDYFNRSTPDKDAQFLGKVQDPEVPQLIEGIYKIPNPNKLSNAQNREDLVAAFLTGFSKKSYPALGADLNSLDMNAVSPNAAPAEYLRLNVQVPPTANPNRLGVVGGDLAGFPNGRRLGDDVVDIALQVLEGVLVRPEGDLKKAVAGLGDAVNRNDVPFLRSFPYIGYAHTGSDPRVGQQPVTFRQNFTSERGVVTTSVTNISPPAPGGFVQLYRINADGSATGLGSMNLTGDGTRSAVKTFRLPVGSKITLNYRVFTKRGSAAGLNRGVPTTFTVR